MFEKSGALCGAGSLVCSALSGLVCDGASIQALGRSEKFVAKWWQKEVREVPKPWGVHDYLTKDCAGNRGGGVEVFIWLDAVSVARLHVF